MASKTSFSQTVMPQWYTNYAQDVLANQQAVSNQPYQAYGGPRIAGFTPTQQQGMAQTVGVANNYQPTLDAATGAAQGTLGRSTMAAAQPYVNAAANQGQMAPAYGALGAATGMTAASIAPTGLAMAQPYLQQAGQSAVGNIGSYMNPYTENVVNRYGELGARTLSEQLMPAIQNKYIQAGQLGGPTRPGTGATGAPSGMYTDTARALRDVQEGVGQQQMQALQQGYTEAANLAQGDLARQAQLAAAAGNLGFQQQGALAQAGQQMAGIGGQYGQLGQNQQQLMSTLAGQVAQMYGQDTANQMAASGQLAQLAQQQQSQGLAGAQAVTGVGAQEQALQQANLDLAYQNFLAQQGYPQQQINQMSQTMGAILPGVAQGTVGYEGTKAPTTSTLSKVAGIASTIGGLASSS